MRPLTTSQNEKGGCRSGCSYPGKLFPFQSGSLREEPEAARRDAQYAAHAAHAVDPSVLDAGPTVDAGPTPPFGMHCLTVCEPMVTTILNQSTR